MKTQHFSAVLVILLSPNVPFYADTNSNLGEKCSTVDFSTTQNEFQINRRNVLDALVANTSLQNGFYKTETGKKSEKVSGLIQCRANISANDCSNCTNDITKVALYRCPNSKNVSIWFRWCFLHYTNASLLRSVEYSSGAWTNDTDLDVLSTVSKGLEFIDEPVQNASKQPMMFLTTMLDAGESGKTYGMAQCTIDIRKADCWKCLDHQLETFKAFILNERGWETHGSICFMRYQDYQFYFNISTPAVEGGRPSSHKGAAIRLISVILALLMVL